jgi:hypothetical protein
VPSYLGNGKHDLIPEQTADPKYISETRMHYFLEDNNQFYKPLVSPIFAKEVSGKPLPPMMIHIGDSERVRDDGIVFQARFGQSQIHVEMYEDMFHAFQMMTLMDSMPILSLKRMGRFVDSLFGGTPWTPERMLWVRRNDVHMPLTRPTAVLEYSREVSITKKVWNVQRQSVWDGLIQPLVDREKAAYRRKVSLDKAKPFGGSVSSVKVQMATSSVTMLTSKMGAMSTHSNSVHQKNPWKKSEPTSMFEDEEDSAFFL